MSARLRAGAAAQLALAAGAHADVAPRGRTAQEVAAVEIAFLALVLAGSVLALRSARGERPLAAGLVGAALGFATFIPVAIWLLEGELAEVLALALVVHAPRVLVIGLACGAVAHVRARRRSG